MGDGGAEEKRKKYHQTYFKLSKARQLVNSFRTKTLHPTESNILSADIEGIYIELKTGTTLHIVQRFTSFASMVSKIWSPSSGHPDFHNLSPRVYYQGRLYISSLESLLKENWLQSFWDSSQAVLIWMDCMTSYDPLYLDAFSILFSVCLMLIKTEQTKSHFFCNGEGTSGIILWAS